MALQRRRIVVIAATIASLPLLAWCPWITDDYAIKRAVEHVGGEDAKFNYLGDEMAVKDIPKVVIGYPFFKAVYFPSEAVWFVTFTGLIV